eukprot:8452099-Alexandrium_andersonii.AAC.1
MREIHAYAANIENMGRGNRVVQRPRNLPGVPQSAGGDGDPPRTEQLNTLLTVPEVSRNPDTQPLAGGDDVWAHW